jgi:predicted PurR-regulated permease PerM
MSKLQRYAIIAIATILVVAALRAAAGFLVPLVFGVVLALTLSPVVRRLERLIPRWIASALVVLTVVGGLGGFAYSMSDEASLAVSSLPAATRQLRQTLRRLVQGGEGTLSQLQQAAKELQRTANENTDRPTTPTGVTPVQVVEPPVDFNNFVWFGSQGVLTFMGALALVAFLVYFLLASGDLFKRKLVRLSGERLSQRRITAQVIDQIAERVGKAMIHLGVAGILVGLCTWALLWWCGVQYAVLWGVAAGLFNCIPYLGPAVVAGALFLASLLQFGDFAMATLIATGSLVITTIEGFLFTPIVFGRSVALNPVAVFVSFMFWGWLWGVPGMFLALPLLTILKTIAESVDDLATVAELLSD